MWSRIFFWLEHEYFCELGKPSWEKNGNSLVFYQTRGGGEVPNNFCFFFRLFFYCFKMILNHENKQYNVFNKYAPTLLFEWCMYCQNLGASYNTEMFQIMDLIWGQYSQKCCKMREKNGRKSQKNENGTQHYFFLKN
jgi:hypothetical protein